MDVEPLEVRPARPGDADAITRLLASEGLEADFVPDEFVVADDGGDVLGCARLKPLPSGGSELASVAVHPDARGRGIGDALVEAALSGADAPVHALALAPGFLARHGFVQADATPPDLEDKRDTCCADLNAHPMVRHPDHEAWDDVRTRYGTIAQGGTSGCCAPANPYPEDVLAELPDEAVRGLGTGDPVGTADVRPGETVIDLGSGAGVDVLRAAREVGPDGQAIGVDLTPEMVEEARRIAADHGYDDVAFLHAPIESVPLDDDVADVVVSNCVLNLSPDKEAALAEARRLLRPGGRLTVSDTVRVQAPDDGDGCGCGCATGAWTADAWRDGLEAAGFIDVEVEVRPPTGRFGEHVGTATIRARAGP